MNINQNNNFGDNIVNIGNQPRILNEVIKKQLEDKLPKDKKIIITAVSGDGEAFNFATEIKDFLLTKEYNIEGVDQAVYSQPVKGQIITTRQNGDLEIIIGNKGK